MKTLLDFKETKDFILQYLKGGINNNMGNTLREEAQNYTAPITKVISDLDIVTIDDLVIEEKEVTDANDDTFKYKYFVVEEVEYRVPNSVLSGIKEILAKYPKTKQIQVLKSGEGLKTKYQVIPINAEKA